MKSTWRGGGQTNREQNKQTHKKSARFMNNRISVLIVVVLLFQHLVLVFVFKQKLCLTVARWLRRVAYIFFCFSVAAL
jgi:succinate dehydrogenase hydrophobic anchor subunit